MKTDTKKWAEKFMEAVHHIQIEFDSFFTEGKIDDYYSLKIDEGTGLLTLVISGDNKLPKEIEDALSAAFIKSKPPEQ